MYIDLIAVGKVKEKFYQEAIKEYLKRLSAYHKLTIIEIEDEKDPQNDSPSSILTVLEKEGEKIQKRLAKDTYLIALAIDGEAKSSEGLAKEFLCLEGLGKTHLTFLIGGSYGLSPTLLEKCDAKFSFSKLTFPHQLMRVIFLEQLYRTSRINSGQKYHK